MNIKNFFQRKQQQGGEQQTEQAAPQPLRIEGTTPAPLTPEPDDAELAAQALLEMLTQRPQRGHRGQHKASKPEPREGTAEYYRALSAKIRQAHHAANLRTARFLAFVEQELQRPDLPAYGPGSLGLLEAELYKRIDTIEREQGELKKRWQHCLANVTVRLMQATHTDSTETPEKETTTDDTD